MTVVCIACEGQGSHERLATPTEVDNGCELGVAYDECEVCKGRGVVFEEPTPPCCDYRDHSPGPCACDEHEPSPMHPDTLLGVADFDYDAQARQGQGPPA